jgi:hypothetical protein
MPRRSKFETGLPEFFIKAFDDPAADLDRQRPRLDLGSVHLCERRGRQWFEQKGQLPTERPLLGRYRRRRRPRGAEPGTDGAIARVTYLEPDAALRLPPTPRSPA